MNDGQIGLAIRALRRRRGWRQVDLSRACGISQTVISQVERGHLDSLTMHSLRRIAAALDARASIDLRWRAGELERLVDADHARLTSAFAERLREGGWHVAAEVTYARFGERGSMDLLGFCELRRALLVVEIKTEVTSAEQILRKLDEKARLAAAIALERLAWKAASVSRLLVIEDASTARRRIGQQRPLFDLALPTRGGQVRRWLREPVGSIAGVLFMSPSAADAGIHQPGGRHRVRKRVSVVGAND